MITTKIFCLRSFSIRFYLPWFNNMGYKGIIIVELMVLVTILDKTLAAAINTDEHMPATENMPQQSLVDSYTSLGSIDLQKPRISRSPSNQIRFGRSQSFVRFGRSNAMNDNYPSRMNSQFNEKLLHLAQHSNGDTMYPNDDNIRIETRGHDDNGFIRFGRRWVHCAITRALYIIWLVKIPTTEKNGQGCEANEKTKTFFADNKWHGSHFFNSIGLTEFN